MQSVGLGATYTLHFLRLKTTFAQESIATYVECRLFDLLYSADGLDWHPVFQKTSAAQ